MTSAGVSAPQDARSIGNRGRRAAVLGAASLVLVSVVAAIAALALGLQPLVVRSGSMAPEVGAGSLALARQVPATDVMIGDVVSVRDGDGRRLVHRVVAVEPSSSADGALQLRLRGDANPTVDARPITVVDVDRVVMTVPTVGSAVAWASDRDGIVLACGATIVVALLALRSGGAGARGAGRPAALAVPALVVAVGAASVTGLVRAEGADAAFSDVATFEAGVIAAHGVRAFDLDGGQSACENVGPSNLAGYYGSVRIKWKIKDPRYEAVWTSPQLTNGGTKVDSQVAATGTSVSTTFRSALLGLSSADVEASLTGGTIQVDGRSRARSATTWISPDSRTVRIERQSLALGGVRCGTVSEQPTVLLTAPTTSGTTTAVQNSVDAGCGTSPRAAACGTAQAVSGNTITGVTYELRRAAALQITQCWNGTGYSAFTCGTWRDATVVGSNPVTWRVPGSGAYGGTLFTGTYTLTIRATDSAGQTHIQVWTLTAS